MNQWLLTSLLRVITRLLPPDRRDEDLSDWLAGCNAEPAFFLTVLSFRPGADHLRAPVEVRPEDVTRVHRFVLAEGRFI